MGGSLLHVHAPEQRGGGRAGTPQLPTTLLTHPVGLFDEPLTKDQDLPYLKGTGASGGALGQRGQSHGAAGHCRRTKVPAAASSPNTPVNPRSHPRSWCTHGIKYDRSSSKCASWASTLLLGGRGERVLPAPFRLISPLTQRAYIFFGEGKTFKPLLLFFWIHGIQRCHTSEHSQPWRLQEPCGVAEVTALLPRTRPKPPKPPLL